jgi:hypothetical protein
MEMGWKLAGASKEEGEDERYDSTRSAEFVEGVVGHRCRRLRRHYNLSGLKLWWSQNQDY